MCEAGREVTPLKVNFVLLIRIQPFLNLLQGESMCEAGREVNPLKSILCG